MQIMWGIMQVSALLLSCSAAPTKRASSTIDVDHRGRAALLRTDASSSSASHDRPATYLQKGDHKIVGQSTTTRYRRGAWGTLVCDATSVAIPDALDCMDAAAALSANYDPVGVTWSSSPEGCVMQKTTNNVVFVLANQTSATITDFPNFAKLCDSGGDTTCPTGYKKEVGDADPPWGDTVLGSYQGGIYADTIEECKIKCNDDSRCLSFKWSPTYDWGQDSKLVCVLNTLQNPDIERVWLDFVWCAKTQATIDTLAGQAAGTMPATPAVSTNVSANGSNTSTLLLLNKEAPMWSEAFR